TPSPQENGDRLPEVGQYFDAQAHENPEHRFYAKQGSEKQRHDADRRSHLRPKDDAPNIIGLGSLDVSRRDPTIQSDHRYDCSRARGSLGISEHKGQHAHGTPGGGEDSVAPRLFLRHATITRSPAGICSPFHDLDRASLPSES